MNMDYDEGFEDGLNAGYAAIPNHYLGRLTAYEVAVYMALAKFAGSKKVCWPSHAKIAGLAGCSESSVIRALNRLVEMGVVDREHRSKDGALQTSNVYHLRTDREPADPRSVSQTDRDARSVTQTPPVCHTDTPGVSQGQTKKHQEKNHQEKKTPSLRSGGADNDGEASDDEARDLLAAIHAIEIEQREAESHDEWLPLEIQRLNLEDELRDLMALAAINAEPPVEVAA